MKKSFLLIMCLLVCPFQSLLAESTREEINRLRSLSQRVDLNLPVEAQERLSKTSFWVEDTISVHQAAPQREGTAIARPLVQQDLELEAMVLENLEYQHQQNTQTRLRKRSR